MNRRCDFCGSEKNVFENHFENLIEPMEETNICAKCHKDLQPEGDWRKCPRCGELVTPDLEETMLFCRNPDCGWSKSD